MKHIFVVNPAAGGGDSESKYLPLILRAVKANNAEYEIHRSLSAADTRNWIRRRSQNGDHVRFYAVGGDGTVNDTMSGLVNCPNAELAVIPCGSGNDFVRNWSKPKSGFTMDSIMKSTKIVPVDVISYGDEYCINMLNIGTDCDIAALAGQIKDKFPGPSGYLTAALRIIPKGRKYHMTYQIDDGEEFENDFLLIAIGNGKYCGGGFKACPKADLQDGKMDICLVNYISGPKLVPLMLGYRKGQHVDDPKYFKYREYVKCEKFKLTAQSDVNVSKDGEISQFLSAEFKVLHNAVNVVVPEGSEFVD